MANPEKAMNFLDFRTRWLDSGGGPLLVFPEPLLDGIRLPASAKEFLLVVGLPKAAAPFLDFRLPKAGGLPTAAEQWGLPAAFNRYRVIGGNGSGDPICVDEDDDASLVDLDHDDHFRVIFMNRSIPLLAESLLAYRQLVKNTQERVGQDAWLDGNVPPDLCDWLETEIHRIDKEALRKGSFWSYELQNLRASQYPRGM